MVTIAEVNREALYISAESSWAETPSTPAMATIRYVSESLAHVKQTVSADTVRSDYQVDNILEVFDHAEGNILTEFRYAEYDLLLQGLFRSSFAAASASGTDIAATSSPDTLTSVGGDFTTANGFKIGMWVKVSGFTTTGSTNNGLWRVTARADGVLTLANGPAAMAAKVAGDTVVVVGSNLRNGTTKSSVLLEKAFLDSDKYMYFTGCVPVGGTFDCQSTQIITAGFDIIGERGRTGTATVSGSASAATTNTAMTASANVGTILVENADATSSMVIKGLTVNIDGGGRTRPCIGSKFTQNVGLGRFAVTGTMDVYFLDNTFSDYFIDHTEVTLSWRATDAAGNIHVFTIPSLRFSAGSPMGSGADDDVTQTLEFMAAQNNETSAYTLQIDKFAA